MFIMDRQIVLDVNLGFGNDYDQLSVPTSNTILSFLNRKIQARAQKKQAHVSAAAASELPVATESVPSARGHDEIIACGPSSSSSCSEDGGARRSQDSTKTVTF